MQGGGQPSGIIERPPDSDRLLAQLGGGGSIALGQGKFDGPNQGPSSRWRRRRPGGKRGAQPSPALSEVAAGKPKGPAGGGQAQTCLRRSDVAQPVERGAEIIVIGAETVE